MVSGKKIKFVIIFILYLFLIQEVFFRLLFPLPEVKNFNRADYMRGNIGLTRSNAIRNTFVVSASEPDAAEFIHTINLYGFRDDNWKLLRDNGTTRVAFVGDSFVEGNMSDDASTIPRGFRQAAKESGMSVEAMNLGIAGGDLSSHILLCMDSGRLFKPDWMVMVIYANDLPAGLDHPYLKEGYVPAYYDAWKPRYLELIGMTVRHEMLPFIWHTGKYTFNQPVPHPDNPWSNIAFDMANRDKATPRILNAFRKGTFNPYRVGGSAYIEKSLQTPFDYSKDFAALKEYLSGLGVKLMVVYLPERGQVTNYYKTFEREYSAGLADRYDFTQPQYNMHRQLLSVQLSGSGIPFLDFTDKIRDEEARGNHLYWDYDDHMRGSSYVFVGNKIFHYWQSVQYTIRQ